jgi:hypothetical protein
MPVPALEEIQPNPKKLAELKQEYRELNGEVEQEIRMLRQRRVVHESKFDEWIARVAALFTGSSKKHRNQ